MSQITDTLPKVLVVDDDQTMHLWAKRHLSGSGFKLVSAFDGREGIEAFKQHLPDVVLVDIDMPGMDGFSVCMAIRGLPEGRNTPLLMVTGNEDAERINSSFVAGATDFVLKPVNWKVLIPRLSHLLKASNTLQQLEKKESRLSKAHKMAKLGHWEWHVVDDKMHWSDEIYEIFELNRDSFIPDQQSFLDRIKPSDRSFVEETFDKVIENKEAAAIEFQIVTGKDRQRHIGLQIEIVENQHRQLVGLLGTIQDITERKDHENQVRHLAYHDAITGLPNRIWFLDMLSKTIELAKRNAGHFAVLFLDLDGFKIVNDLYGHHVGDLLLKEIARRLAEGLRQSDVTSRNSNCQDYGADIARLGGDEFIILLNDLVHPEDAAIAAGHIQKLITGPIEVENKKMYSGVSIGIAVFPDDGSDSETLLKNADVAMYHAKQLGKGNYQFFHGSMNVKAKKRMEMENYMQQALINKELRLYYQPIVNATSGRLMGLEALMRWESPQLGFLTPEAFIPLAEDNGMILQFGEWAMREICIRHKEVQRLDMGFLTIAINLSSLQFKQQGFVAMIKAILAEYEVDPRFMVVEITEGILMKGNEKTLAILWELKKIGIKISIDDFGTGYSSLSYLKSFPVDSLKIDRSFVNELPNNSDDAAIVRAILTLAKTLHLDTIAEGVETEKQREFLQISDCHSIQGFLLSKPMPFDALKTYLTTKLLENGASRE